jgi:hypothetical protein
MKNESELLTNVRSLLYDLYVSSPKTHYKGEDYLRLKKEVDAARIAYEVLKLKLTEMDAANSILLGQKEKIAHELHHFIKDDTPKSVIDYLNAHHFENKSRCPECWGGYRCENQWLYDDVTLCRACLGTGLRQAGKSEVG